MKKRSKPRLKQSSIYFSEQELEAIKKMARIRDTSMARVIRAAIRQEMAACGLLNNVEVLGDL